MKRNKQKRLTGARPSPAPVSFGEWRKKFDASLRVGTQAWKAFRALLQEEQRSRERLHLPKLDDIRGHVLRRIHAETSFRPPDKNAPKLAKALEKLIKQLGPVIATIAMAGGKIETDGGLGLDLSADLHLFHKIRNSATATLELLQEKGPESSRRDATDQSLWFLALLDGLVPEPEAYALAELALKAHGYPDHELDDLNPGKVHAGTVRKRKYVLKDLHANTLIKVKNYALRSTLY